MKVLNLFMIIIFFLAGFDPCGEEADCRNSDRFEIQASQHETKGNLEVCSPLCNCTNCCFSVLIPSQFQLPEKFHHIRKLSDIDHSGKPTNLSFGIWQPPKVIS